MLIIFELLRGQHRRSYLLILPCLHEAKRFYRSADRSLTRAKCSSGLIGSVAARIFHPADSSPSLANRKFQWIGTEFP